MTDHQHAPGADATDLVELRIGLAGLVAEVNRMRVDLGPLAALPVQLKAATDLTEQRLTNAIDNHNRDVNDLRSDITHVERRAREAVAEVKEWQTWAIRVVGALVIAAVLAVALGTGGT